MDATVKLTKQGVRDLDSGRKKRPAPAPAQESTEAASSSAAPLRDKTEEGTALAPVEAPDPSPANPPSVESPPEAPAKT